MQTNTSIADWKQRGHISLWRYKPMPRLYSGWHFAADPEGCESLRELFLLFLESAYPVHRSLRLTDPRSVRADRIFSEHELQVCFPHKLRIRFDPEAPDDESTFHENDERLDVFLGREWLREWQSALPEVARGNADFSLWFEVPSKDPMKRISFWWWPQNH